MFDDEPDTDTGLVWALGALLLVLLLIGWARACSPRPAIVQQPTDGGASRLVR